MNTIDSSDLANVTGGQGLGQVVKDLPAAMSRPTSEIYQGTLDFIANHQFFHQGLMDAPIGGGKHFRNVPFIGPSFVAAGAATGNANTIAKGVQITRATWAAP